MRESKTELKPNEIEKNNKLIVIFPTPTAATRTGWFNYPINIKFNDSISIYVIFFKIEGIVNWIIKSSLYFSVSLSQVSNNIFVLSFYK